MHGTCFRFKTLPIRKCNILELLFFNVLGKGTFNQRNHFWSPNKQTKKQWTVSIFNLPRAWDYKDIISCPTGDEPIWSTVTWLTPLRNRCRLDTTGNFAAIIENKQYKKAWNALINFFFWEKKTMKLIKANAFISNSMPINGYGRLSYRVSWLVTQSSIVRFGKDVAWRSKRTSAVPTSIPSISEEKDRRVDGPDLKGLTLLFSHHFCENSFSWKTAKEKGSPSSLHSGFFFLSHLAPLNKDHFQRLNTVRK